MSYTEAVLNIAQVFFVRKVADFAYLNLAKEPIKWMFSVYY